MSIVPTPRRGDRVARRERRARPAGVLDGSVHVAAADHRVYVLAYYRSPEAARDARDGVVTTWADHASAPERVTLTAPGPGAWYVSVLERHEGPDGFSFAAGAEALPLLPA